MICVLIVDNILFFAGEHTSTDYPATVHGAYLSGQDCANRIIATTAPSSSTTSDFSTEEIVGIAVGGGLGVIIVIGIIYYMLFMYNKELLIKPQAVELK